MVVPFTPSCPFSLTPVEASFHYWYGLVPRPATAGALLSSDAIFSGSVILATMSLARATSGRAGLQKGMLWNGRDVLRQGL